MGSYIIPHAGQFIMDSYTLITGQCMSDGVAYEHPHAGQSIKHGPILSAGQCISNGV